MKEYNKRPEVIARNKKYYQENKEKIAKRAHEYNQRPEVKEKRRDYNKRPKVIVRKKVYLKKNKKKIRLQSKKYNLDNKDKITKQKKEYMKKYIQDNTVKLSKQKREYYQKNKDNFIEQSKEYYKQIVKEENKRRKKLGLPLVGEGYEKEMELLHYINNLFQGYEIITHCRKPLMNWKPYGLEIDIYFPKLKLAFEYMGRQHYKRINYFHKTKEEFEYQQYRDRCKKKICKMLGITLIIIKYNEDLSEQLILTKLKYFKFPIIQERIG